MTRVFTSALCAAAFLVIPQGVKAAENGPREAIEKAIKAHGGKDFLLKHQAGQMKSKGKITLAGVGELEFTQEISYMLPDKLKDSQELAINGQKISIATLANGDKISISANGNAVEVTDRVKAALKDGLYMLKVARLVTLLDKEYELSSVGESKVGETPVIGVRVSSKGQKDINLFFDKESWLLTKVEHRTADPTTGNEITEERIILEYKKDKDGLPVPKKVIVKHDGKTFVDAETVEVNYLEKLDDNEFKK